MKLLVAEHKNKRFFIEEDYPEVGYYLYVYENGQCIKDDLQDDIETCKKVAFDDYEVPYNKWMIKPMDDLEGKNLWPSHLKNKGK